MKNNLPTFRDGLCKAGVEDWTMREKKRETKRRK
jgi:hypothetical protein